MKRKGGFYNYILVLPCILLSCLTTVIIVLIACQNPILIIMFSNEGIVLVAA